jgi:hypothetical protein
MGKRKNLLFSNRLNFLRQLHSVWGWEMNGMKKKKKKKNKNIFSFLLFESLSTREWKRMEYHSFV